MTRSGPATFGREFSAIPQAGVEAGAPDGDDRRVATAMTGLRAGRNADAIVRAARTGRALLGETHGAISVPQIVAKRLALALRGGVGMSCEPLLARR